jgi:chemotaxis protein MotB
MSKMMRGLVMATALCVTVMAVGCNEATQEKITTLQQDNERLLGDYNACQEELMATCDERDRWHDQYLAAKADNDALRGELASMPDVPEGWTAVPGGAMIALDAEFLFNSGQAILRKAALSKINQVVDTIQMTYPDKEVVVYGHTDDQPIKKSKWKDNFELSTQRALSVVRQLKRSGIDADRLVAAGCGEFQPIEDNATKQGRQKNRRVEIFVLDPQVRTASRQATN